jgi:hypothetical protein
MTEHYPAQDTLPFEQALPISERPESRFNKPIGYNHAYSELGWFADNTGLLELAELYGVGKDKLPWQYEDEDIPHRLRILQEIGQKYWDFRNGAERQAVDFNDEALDDPDSKQGIAIFEAARSLGMVESSRPSIDADYLVILGGANKAPYDRLKYGLEVTQGYFGHAVYLGSTRPVSDAEREKAKDYAPNARTEFDLGCGAFETLLDAHMVDEVTEVRDGDTWGMRLYEYEHNGETKSGFVLSTPQTIGARRATTYDNYKFFADRAELAKNPDTKVVAVTTGFYVPAQHLPAVQELTLPYGTQVETIGHDAAYSGVTRKASQLLQETKAAIDAAVRLQNELDKYKD